MDNYKQGSMWKYRWKTYTKITYSNGSIRQSICDLFFVFMAQPFAGLKPKNLF